MVDTKPIADPPPLFHQVACVIGVLLMAAAVIMICIWATEEDESENYGGGLNWDEYVFNWHPVLMISGVMFSAGMGVTAFRLTAFLDHFMSKVIHSLFMIGAVVCFSIGMAAIWKSKDDRNQSNLSSLHTWIGLMTIILIGMNYLGGFFHFFLHVFPESITDMYLPFHKYIGKWSLISGLVAVISGITYRFHGCQRYRGYDENPAEHYLDIEAGCRLAYGVGVVVYFGVMFILFGLSAATSEYAKPATGEETRV
jgi:cytochrome b-561